jgi:hypothetical protein
MKKAMAIALVSTLFISVSALAIVLYDDNSPNPRGCKTCVYKAVVGN